MILLGLFSVFLLLFLPGLCLLEILFPDRKDHPLLDWAGAVAASAITHFTFVFWSTALGFYGRPAALAWAVSWALVTAWLLLRRPAPRGRFLGLLALSLTACAGLWFFNQYATGAGRIHWEADVVFSWNRWALEFTAGILPLKTAEYPQLIPSLWSLTYQMIGDTRIEFFSRMIMPFFYGLIPAVLLGLALATRRLSHALAVLLGSALTLRFLHPFPGITSGVVEGPAAFMATSAAVFLILAAVDHGKNNPRWVLLGLLSVAAAALVKHSSLPFAAAFPLMLLFAVDLPQRLGPRETAKRFLTRLGFLILLVAPFYLYVALGVSQGTNVIIAKRIAGTLLSSDLPSRFLEALQLLRSKTGGLWMLLPAVILWGFSLRDRPYRVLAFLWILPWIALWAWGASYDMRNLAPVLPSLGLGLSLGLESLATLLFPMLAGRGAASFARFPLPPWADRRRWTALFFAASLALLLGTGFAWRGKDLLALQHKAQWDYTGDYRPVNKALAPLRASGALTGLLVANYPFIERFPEYPGLRILYEKQMFRDQFLKTREKMTAGEPLWILVTEGYWAPKHPRESTNDFKKIFPEYQATLAASGNEFRLYRLIK